MYQTKLEQVKIETNYNFKTAKRTLKCKGQNYNGTN